VFIVSPAAQFGNLDRGGLTASERAFTRAAYYLVVQGPRQIARAQGATDAEIYAAPEWSLKLTWGKIENRGGRWGRSVGVRLYARAAGRRHTARHRDTAFTANRSLQSRAAVESAG